MSGLAKKHQKLSRKLISLVFVGCLLFIQVISPPLSAHADEPGSFIADKISGEVLDHQLYYYTLACASKVDIDKLPEDELRSYKWFNDGNVDDAIGAAWDFASGTSVVGLIDKIAKTGGYIQYSPGGYLIRKELADKGSVRGDMYKTAVASCDSGKYLEEALGRFGLTKPYEAFCSLSIAYSKRNGGLGDKGSKQNCIDGEGQGDFDASGSMSDQQKAFKKVLDSTEKGPAAAGTLKPHAEYVRAYRTFTEGCSPKLVKPYEQSGGAANKSNAFKLATVSQQGDIKFVYATTDKTNDATQLAYVATSSGGYKTITCGQAATMTRDLAPAYSTWLKDPANKDQAGSTVEGSSGEGDGDGKTSCAVEGLGWIICPVFNVLAKMVDETYKIVEDLLAVQPLTTTGASQGLYEAWQSMRNIANAAFVVVFLIVIYTQVTGSTQGTGIFSNYGVKKLLPRIILAAILVNSSYWLCAIAIDISNILGASLKGLLSNTQGSIIGSPEFSSNFSSGESGWQGIVGPVLAFSIVGVGGYLALGSIIVLLPTVLLAILTAFLVLTLRQALIVVLVAIAPFAFVAYLLPNTQEWFKRWLDLFKTMLLMYPLIAIVFGGSALASHIIMQGRPDSWTIQLMGASVAIIPLAITPVIMKTAGGLLNRFGGIVNNPNRGPIDALRKRAEATAGRIKNNRDIRAVNKTGIGRGSFLRRGRIASEQKREAIQKRRDADVDTFGNTNTGVRGYRAKAIDAQETAQLTGRELENEVKKKHLEANVDLHTRVVDSGLALKHVEDLHRNKATSAYINRNRSQFREGRDAEDELENTKNDAELSYQRSQMGQARASTRQSIEDQLAREKADQKTNYLESADGQVFSVNRKNAEKSAGIADKGTTLAAKQSEQGQQLEQREKGVDDLIQAVDSDAETIYLQSDAGKSARSDAINAKRQATVQGKVVEDIALSSHEGQRISQSEKSADARLKITETDASTAFVQSAVGEALTVSSAVAQGRLGAAEKTTEALMSELKTEKGSQLHPEYTAEAQVLTDTDIQQRVQTQRASAAAGVATVEYAKKITDDTSGLAVTAGGIDKFGEQRAKAAATQTMIDEFNKNVKSEQTTMSKTVSDQYDASGNLLPDAPGPDGQPTLRQIALDPTQSEERRAAAAGMYMKTAPMKDLHSFVDAVGSLPGSNEEEKSVRSSMLMQISEDMSRVPFAYGDTAKTAIRRGDYTTAQYGTHEQQLITRVQRKMSGTEWQSMDPDDRAAIRKLVSTDEGRTALGSVGMSNLQGAFEDINNTPEVRAKTKTDARQEANRVAASLGLNLPFPDTETPPV